MDYEVYCASRPSCPPIVRSYLKRMSDKAALAIGRDPDKWHAWLFTKADQCGLFVRGALCPLKTKGPWKGEPNFRQKNLDTVATVWLGPEESR